MKILLLCDRVPDAPMEGLSMRVLNMGRHIAERHSIDLLCLRQPWQTAGVPQGLFDRVWSVERPAARPSAGWRAPFMGWSAKSLYVPSPDIARLLENEIDPNDYDVIWDAGAVLIAQLPTRWDSVPVVADLVDDMVLTYRRAGQIASGPLNKLRMWKYARVFGNFERDVMRRAVRCVVVARDDADSFSRVSPDVPVTVIPIGVDSEYFSPDGTPIIPGRLVFEGNMSFPPNAMAATYLVREIMPHIWAKRPDVTVALVGRDPGSDVKALAAERVFVTGSVPDVRQYVREAELFVCPLVSGAGIKTKLLQAWAMGRPIVATTLSIGGLDASNGVELLVRDGPTAFASGVLELLDDPAQAAAMAARGRQAATTRFIWPAVAAAFERLLAEAAAAKRVSG